MIGAKHARAANDGFPAAMRIRKKTPKPSARRPPLYFVGYRGTAPATEELTIWYDREYGGPLVIRHEEGAPESWQATHGPWSTHVVMPLPMTHVADVMKQLSWEHDLMGAVAPSVAPPRDMPDTILFAARIAKGLTLLSQGTAYDVTTQAYLNPSDWQDRPLGVFRTGDHVTIMQTETDDGRDWLYTVGLKKFGLDEVELFQPAGLSTVSAKEHLATIADELTRQGHVPKVGSTFTASDLSVQVLKHRTASPAGIQLVLREVAVAKP
jgi:hypothetical protein